jgi:DNA-binding transcriptional regulator LsrR (DeoR family)
VIVLAIGKARCEVVLRCVQIGLVNELIIDQELARELTAHLIEF